MEESNRYMDKETTMIRLGCLKNAVETVKIETETGVFKPSDANDILSQINSYYNRYQDWIYKDAPETITPQIIPKQPGVILKVEKDGEPRDATPKMKSAMWAISYGKEANEDAALEVSAMGLDKYTLTKGFVPYETAHSFLDRYKKTT